jgi:hypothetical protein
LPKSCHSLNLGMENFASILSGRLWPIVTIHFVPKKKRIAAVQISYAKSKFIGFNPQRSTNTDAYCKARQRLPLEMLSTLVCHTGRLINAQAHDTWLRNGSRYFDRAENMLSGPVNR